MSETTSRVDRQTFFWGILLLTAGIVLGLAELALLAYADLWEWWPLALVAFGLGRLITCPNTKCRRTGVWLALVGCWLLLNTLSLFGFHWSDSWPLLLIGGGLLDVVWPTPDDDRYDGFVWLAIGGWLLLNTRDILDFTWRDSWPLLLVFVGAAIVLKALLQAIPALAGGRQE